MDLKGNREKNWGKSRERNLKIDRKQKRYRKNMFGILKQGQQVLQVFAANAFSCEVQSHI